MASEGPRIMEHMHKSVSHTIYDVKWVPASAKFVAIGTYPRDTGCFQIFELDGAELSLIAEYEQPAGLKCGSFGASSSEARHLATGSFSGLLQVFDLERPEQSTYKTQAHEGVLHGMDAFGGQANGCGAPEIATCGRDGGVRVWDTRQPNAPVAAFVPAEGSSCRECWSVAIGNSFNNDERCVLAGYDNGDVKMFDLRTNTVRWEANVGNGVCSLQFDRPDIPMNKFVAACLETSITLFDARTQHPTKGFALHTEKLHQGATLWFVKHLPQNRDVFMVGAGDGSLSLHKYCYPDSRVLTNSQGEAEGVVGTLQKLASTTASSQPVASFDWHPDKQGLYHSAGAHAAMDDAKEGDLVWAKIRGFPWWPGQVMDPQKATELAKSRQKPGRVLVAFAGDNSFNWLLPKDLLSFDDEYDRLKRQPKVSKHQAPMYALAVEQMRELSDRRKGAPPATSHHPADFLDPSSTAADTSDSEEGAGGKGGARSRARKGGGALGERAELPPTPSADMLRSCSARCALMWLRGVARGQMEGQDVDLQGSPLKVSPNQRLCGMAQLAGLRRRLAASSKALVGEGGRQSDRQTSGKRRGRKGAQGGPTAKCGRGKLGGDLVLGRAAKEGRGAGGRGRKRGVSPVCGGDLQWEAPRGWEEVVGAVRLLRQVARGPGSDGSHLPKLPPSAGVLLLRGMQGRGGGVAGCGGLLQQVLRLCTGVREGGGEGSEAEEEEEGGDASAAGESDAGSGSEGDTQQQEREGSDRDVGEGWASKRRRGGRGRGGLPVEAEGGKVPRHFDYQHKLPASQEAFLQALASFYQSQGAKSLSSAPVIDKQPVDLYAVLRAVAAAGGYEEVTATKSWRQVARSWRPEGVTSQVAFKLHKQYRQYLLAYERHLQEGCPSCPLEHSSGRGAAGNNSPAVASPNKKPKRHNRRGDVVGGAEGRGAGKLPKDCGSARATGEAPPALGAAGTAGAGAAPPAGPAEHAGNVPNPGPGPDPTPVQLSVQGKGPDPAGVPAASARALRAEPAPGSQGALATAQRVQQGAIKGAGGGGEGGSAMRGVLIPKRGSAGGVGGAGGGGKSGAVVPNAKCALVLRFPKQYGLPTKAQIESRIGAILKGSYVRSTTLFWQAKTVVVVLQQEQYAKAAYSVLKDRAARFFNMPTGSVTVSWEAEKEKQRLDGTSFSHPQSRPPRRNGDSQHAQRGSLPQQQASVALTPPAAAAPAAAAAPQGGLQPGVHGQAQQGMAVPTVPLDPRRLPRPGALGGYQVPSNSGIPLPTDPRSRPSAPQQYGQAFGSTAPATQPFLIPQRAALPAAQQAAGPGQPPPAGDGQGGVLSAMDLMSILQAAGVTQQAQQAGSDGGGIG